MINEMNESHSSQLQTVAYAWGCGPPTLPLFCSYGGSTEAAHSVATAKGWDPARAGAWAIELTLPATRQTALCALESEARRDPAVEGFTVPDSPP